MYAQVRDLVSLEHRVDCFLAHVEASGDFRYGDCRVLLGFPGHGRLDPFYAASGAAAVRRIQAFIP